MQEKKGKIEEMFLSCPPWSVRLATALGGSMEPPPWALTGVKVPWSLKCFNT